MRVHFRLVHWESVLPIPGAPARYASLGLGAAIILWLYVPVLVQLAVTWWTHDYAEYLPLIPLFSAILIWQQRAELRKIPRQPWLAGLVLVAGAIGMLLLARVWSEQGIIPRYVPPITIETASLLILIWGLVLTVGGLGLTRKLAFPLGFLALMLPLTRSGLTPITRSLQNLTAWGATVGLDTIGIPVYQEAILLYLPTVTLDIDKGCAGWTYLWTLVVFGAAFAHVTQPGFWRKIALVISAVPFALLANSSRVIGTGVIGYRLGPEAISGDAHEYFGQAVYWTFMALFVFFGFFLKRWRANAESCGERPPRKRVEDEDGSFRSET